MAVPKRKTSKSRRNMRRSHDGLKRAGMTRCPECDEVMHPHRACPTCGSYRGREVIATSVI
ncbi:MAG: 50S ribosomal protein L32 [Zetaproteobacteria bacterium]|nr:MAG: 50S ribosomal protein L32 [Zetaproteobacteria bacterium]